MYTDKQIYYFLVASPSLGSAYADWLSPLAQLFGHAQADALRFVGNNNWLLDLDKEFTNLKEGSKITIKGKELVEDTFIIVRGLIKRQDVEAFSGAKYFGEQYKVPGSDHFSIAKPKDKFAIQHRLLRQFIRDNAFSPTSDCSGATLAVSCVPSFGLYSAGHGSIPSLQPLYVHIGRLPRTDYERLVGREAQLARLDEAWADGKTNILSLIGEGGAGKSALVNKWLTRLQADGYRGAEAVLGWSFYNQGSKERETSSDYFLNWAMKELELTLDTTSATAKGEMIAEALVKRRVLLVLDGVEPLQRGPAGSQVGEMKDLGVLAILRHFSAAPPDKSHGLIVLTSRLKVKDIAHWKDSVAPVVDVDDLSDDFGAMLLRDNGVEGEDEELRTTSRDFGGHPLALGLLASFLRETQFGDARRRDRIRALFADVENPHYDHAKRVMESLEKEWLTDQPVLHAIMRMVGLFDRPANEHCLRKLRKKPAIKGLTEKYCRSRR